LISLHKENSRDKSLFLKNGLPHKPSHSTHQGKMPRPGSSLAREVQSLAKVNRSDQRKWLSRTGPCLTDL